VIAYVPSLKRAFLVSEEDGSSLPDFITSPEPTPEERFRDRAEPDFSHTILMLTEDCNLRCRYCYGDAGCAKGKLGIDMAKAATDWISDNALRCGRKSFSVQYFGGEPTLAWGLMMDIHHYAVEVAMAKSLQYRCGLTTNGIMSSAKVDWILANTTGKFNLSIDGPAAIHDVHRPFPDGSGSLETVLRTAQHVYELAPTRLAFRATVSDFSVRQLPEVVRFLGERFPGITQSYEPLSGCGRDGSDIGEPDPMLYAQQFFEGYCWARSHGIKLRTSIMRLSHVSLRFCGASGGNFVVSAGGLISGCHRMANGEFGDQGLVYGRWGEEDSKFVIDLPAYRRMSQIHLGNLPACNDCFAKYSCRGDCMALKAACGIDYHSQPSYRCEAIRWLLAQVIHWRLIHQ
jgi:uncharacterized protein